MAKYLIINADDFGMSQEANLAILELMREGKISSASLMANGMYYDEAVRMIKEHELKSIGIHLTLTRDGFKVDNPLIYGSLSQAKSILDQDDQLYMDVASLNKNSRFSDLVKECELQFRKLIQDQINFTHVDNHMYSLFPAGGLKGYFAVFLAYMKTCGIKKRRGFRFARRYRELVEVFPIWSGRRRNPILKAAMFFLNLVGLDYAYAFPYNAKNIPSLEEKIQCFEEFLRDLPEGITELHVHPFIDSARLREYNPTWENRVHEYQMLRSLDLKSMLDKYNIVLVSFESLLDLTNS